MSATYHPRLLSVDEVADRCHLSRTSIYRLLRHKRLTAHKIGRQWRVPSTAVDDLIQHGLTGTSDKGGAQ
jgi:excisionase family DNA binding protein